MNHLNFDRLSYGWYVMFALCTAALIVALFFS